MLPMNLRRDQFPDFMTLKLLASRLEVSHRASMTRRALPAPKKSLFPELAYHPRRSQRSGRSGVIELSAPAIVGVGGAANSNQTTAAARRAGAPTTAETFSRPRRRSPHGRSARLSVGIARKSVISRENIGRIDVHAVSAAGRQT